MSQADMLPFCFVASHYSTAEALWSKSEVYVLYFCSSLVCGTACPVGKACLARHKFTRLLVSLFSLFQ
jgi:hypothetical protein